MKQSTFSDSQIAAMIEEDVCQRARQERDLKKVVKYVLVTPNP